MSEETRTTVQLGKRVGSKTENPRYIDFTLDFSFRHFFAKEHHLDLLKDFLNGVFEGRKTIREVKLGKTDRKGDQRNNRGTVFDVYCTGDDGDNFVVEMQKGTQTNFKDRILFYTANLIQEQGKSVDSNWDYELTEIYFVAVMDFVLEDTTPGQYIHDVRLIDVHNSKEFYKKLGYIYIELPKFNKAANQLESSEDKWLYCLKNMKTLDKIPLSLSNDPIFKKLFEVAEVSNLKPAEMSLYQRELKRKRDNYSREQYIQQKALKQGLEQGIEQGAAKGEQKKAIEMANKLIAKGMSTNEISELTGLTIKEIEAL